MREHQDDQKMKRGDRDTGTKMVCTFEKAELRRDVFGSW